MRRSSISKTIDTAGKDAQYDSCVKRLLSVKIILAWILKECAVEFKNLSVWQIAKDCIEGEPQVSKVAVDQDELDDEEELGDRQIEGLNAEDVSIQEGKVFYDVRFFATAPGEEKPIQLIINVEAQNDAETPYPLIKRAVYYVSRLISSQKNKVFVKSHYEKIRKVYSIWILTDAPKEKANTITRYRIVEEPVVGDVSEKESDYDLLTIVVLRLGSPDEAESKSILRLLDVLLSAKMPPADKKAILENDFDVPMTTSMKEEVTAMCNVASGIRKEAEKEGEERGLKIGEERGLKIGEERGLKIGEERGAKRAKQETRTEVALNLMKSLKLSADEALNVMGVPSRNRASLLKSINARLAAE